MQSVLGIIKNKPMVPVQEPTLDPYINQLLQDQQQQEQQEHIDREKAKMDLLQELFEALPDA